MNTETAQSRTKIQAVTIAWAREGRTTDALKGQVGGRNVWKQFQDVLNNVEPPKLGCYKTNFVVTFENGETYEGRLELDADQSDNDVVEHILNHCAFYTGRRRPAHLTEAQYRAILADVNPAPYAAFLEGYQIGDV